MEHELFFDYIKKESNLFARALNKGSTIRVISHLDADGMSSAGIMCRLLIRYGKKFHLTIVKQLDVSNIPLLMSGEYSVFLFTDLGSGQITEIIKHLGSRQAIIIDHHPPEAEIDIPNIVMINPHTIGVDGGTEISASTTSFFIAREFVDEDLSHLALIGCIGDRQETIANGLNGFNKYLLESPETRINIFKGLRVYGRNSRPLHEAVAYSNLVPGVNNEPSHALQFLSELGINLKKGDEWRSANDLSEDEEQKIITEIVLRRSICGQDIDGVVGNVYSFYNGEGERKDAQEFATLLNSCGRLGDYALGVSLCLREDEDVFTEADSSMLRYKRKLLKVLRWIDSSRGNADIVKEGERTTYILGSDKVDDTLIGTACSILASSGNIKKDMIVGFANSGNSVKVSGRMVNTKAQIDIGSAIIATAKLLGGEGGGHKMAGGAKIEPGLEGRFIEEFEKTIKNIKG